VAKYLLDTTALIDHLRGRAPVVALLESLVRDGHQLGVCPVNVAELYAGLSPPERGKVERFVDSLELFSTGWDASKRAGQFKYDYAHRGLSITITDALIAAAAIEAEAILVTANTRDFPMPTLKIIAQP
jgi:predicted nucleic acid-binding protein